MTIATKIPVLVMTGFVLQGHILATVIFLINNHWFIGDKFV